REDENYVLLGDFNIKNTMDETMRALTKAGFILPPELFPSNLLGTKYYDQIAFRTRKDKVTFLSAGVFNFTKSLFKPEHYPHYAPVLPERHRDLKQDGTPKDTGKDKDYFSKRWVTWQMSDHLPLWVELAIDFSDEHLLHNVEEGTRDIPAQFEYGEKGEDLTRFHGEAPRLPEDEEAEAAKAEEEKPRGRKRKKPKVAEKEKVGTARPNTRLTLGEAWKIFWFVATGKADKIRKLREEAERKAKK
ncbi:MAG: hypothetical protein MRY64_14250, partial [Hyphomonadaceae bacterium]|nr:hypothetical protein [Hyphomonadaceae bacterium]